MPVGEKDRLADIVANFHDEHRRTYGHGSNADPVDIVSIRVYARVVAAGRGLRLREPLHAAAERNGAHAQTTAPQAYFGRDVGLHRHAGDRARRARPRTWRAGPLIVEEYDATCVVPHDARARLDALGNIEIELPEDAA